MEIIKSNIEENLKKIVKCGGGRKKKKKTVKI